MIQTTLPTLGETVSLDVARVTDAAMIMGAWVVPSSTIERSFAQLVPSRETISIHSAFQSGQRVMCARGEEVMYAHPSFRGLTIFPSFTEPVETYISEYVSRIVLNDERIELRKEKTPSGRFLYCFDYGAFPQELACPKMQEVLEQFKDCDRLQKTGHVYTMDAVGLYEDWFRPLMHPLKDGMDVLRCGGSSEEPFTPIETPEYQFGETSRYVRLTAKLSGQQLSNGELTEKGKAYWVEVQPLTWVVDPHSERVYARKGVLSGLPWHHQSDCSDYQHSDIAAYLTTCFDVEVMQSHAFCKKYAKKHQAPHRIETSRAKDEIPVWQRLETKLERE